MPPKERTPQSYLSKALRKARALQVGQTVRIKHSSRVYPIDVCTYLNEQLGGDYSIRQVDGECEIAKES